ncbi:MAG: type II toxin-antitoxin system RelE/ParE family toxin [Rhodospirillaceae bacterium]|nr:type II toxin-antitoxin system RelE/ParE family toxin [Rhodospirillaceae bacterium]
MAKPVLVTAKAKADLSAISDFTDATWGPPQRRAYLGEIKTRMMALGLMPGLGRRRDELNPGWRTLPCGSHVILYIERDDRIEILRVFHGRQDIARAPEE